MSSNKLLLLALSLSIALLVSLFLAYKAYRRSHVFEQLFSDLLLDPYQLNAFPNDTNQDPSSDAAQENDAGHITVVFFGDSRAAQWPFPELKGNYSFLNRGIQAQSSVLAAGRWAKHVAPLKPDYLVVQVGVNDLRLVADYPARRDAIVENSKVNIRRIVDDSVELGTTVILSTIFPLGQPPINKWGDAADRAAAAVDEVNAYLLSMASERVIVMDTSAILAGENGRVRREYSSDYLHINDAGYEALNRELVQILVKDQ